MGLSLFQCWPKPHPHTYTSNKRAIDNLMYINANGDLRLHLPFVDAI